MIPDGILPECKELIKSILKTDPTKRATIENIKKNKWYRSVPLPETCRSPIQNINVASIRNPIFNPDIEIMNFLIPLQLVENKEMLLGMLSATKPSLVRVLYRQLEWRKMKMDSLQNDKIHEAIKRRKILIRKKKKEGFEKTKLWKKNQNTLKNCIKIEPLTKIGLYVQFC